MGEKEDEQKNIDPDITDNINVIKMKEFGKLLFEWAKIKKEQKDIDDIEDNRNNKT